MFLLDLNMPHISGQEILRQVKSEYPDVNVIVMTAEGYLAEFDLDGQGPHPLEGTQPGDIPLRFDQDGVHIFVQAADSIPSPIFRVNSRTGERTLWRELSPGDPAGIVSVDRVQISVDGMIQVYSHRRHTSALEIIEGLR